MKPDIHQTITDSIVRAIENGAEDFAMPWTRLSAGLPFNVASRNPYRGVNVIQLWVHAASRGYASPTWGTYKQWQDKGAQVRKGERAAPIVFYKTVEKRAPADDEAGTYMLAKGYSVFNAEQVDGYEAPTAEPLVDATQAVAAADSSSEKSVGVRVAAVVWRPRRTGSRTNWSSPRSADAPSRSTARSTPHQRSAHRCS